MRSCTPCFTKRLECSGSETPNRCRHCAGKRSYCKGPIETPRLLDLERFDATLAALHARYYKYMYFHPEGEKFEAMQVDIRSEFSFDQNMVSDSQTHRLQLPGLGGDFRSLWKSSNIDGILDGILPADVPLYIAPKPGLYDLTLYERLCRRFCACISLLRRPDQSTLEKTHKDDHRAVHIIVGFLGQLSQTASSIFAEIFEHVRGCCFATRDRRGTPTVMFILAEHMGRMHKEILQFMDVMGHFSDLQLPLRGLFPNASQSLEELENLGRGLCSRGFESTYKLPVSDIAGIHLIPCFEPSPYNDADDPYTLSQHISFLEVLHGSTLGHYSTSNRPCPIMGTNDTAEPWPNMDVEAPNLLVGHDSQDSIGNGQDMIIDDHVPSGVEKLQVETNAISNPVWPLGLHDFADTEASVGTDHLHAGITDSMAHSQDVAWKQQPGHAYLQGTIPEYANMGGSMLTYLHDVMAFSQTQLNTTPRVETANNTAISDATEQLCALPVLTPMKVPKRVSKRKLIKTVFSRKKPCLTSSRFNHSEDSSAPATDLSSKLAIRTESAAKIAITSGTVSSTQPSDDYLAERSRANRVPVWEPGRNGRTNIENAGIARDVKVSDSERRPMSWPHRSPWRKSLDISVAVLTKGFEKLMTERGESSPSGI